MHHEEDDGRSDRSDAKDEAAAFAAEVASMRRKMGRLMGRLALRKLRELHRRWPRPRVSRLTKQARTGRKPRRAP